MNIHKLKSLAINLLLPLFLFLTTIVNAQIDFTSIHYRGIRPDDRLGLKPVYNPGRGFRIEDEIDLTKMNPLFRKGIDSTSHLKSEALKYAADSVSVVLTTLYLPVPVFSPVPDSALKWMKIYFDTLRSMGLKVVLRLTYKPDPGTPKGPGQADIMHHLDQFAQLFHNNKDVILAVQSGMIGSMDNQIEKIIAETDKSTQLVVLKKLLSVVPVPLQVQVRLPDYKNLLPVGDPDYERVGFYDDKVVSKADKVDAGLHLGTPAFEQIVRESATSIVDGALPLGSWSLGKGGFLIDGYKTALLLRQQHFTTFSLVRNNTEDGEGKHYSMENWRNVPVGPDQLTADKMPFSADYFTSKEGNIVQRPLFDYIRDHLGYRIELQQLMLPAKRPDNSPIHLKLELINRGFSAVKQSCTVAFVLIDPTGKVYELPSDADPSSWQPFVTGDLNYKPITHVIQYQGKLPLHLMPGKYKLGVWIADAGTTIRYNCRYAIRCANGNVGWWISRDGQYGINVLTSLTISK